MRVFRELLDQHSADPSGRTWAFVAYDQLHDGIGLLAEVPASQAGIVLVETRWKPNQRPYHRQKLALLLASQRHFALEQAARGVAVRYVVGEADYAELLRPVVKELGPLQLMQPAERELRRVLEPLVADGSLTLRDHDGWLTSESDFRAATRGKKTWRMDAFYRRIRQQYGWLLTPDGKPEGGKWSHDADNRKPWKGDPPPPEPPRFEANEVTAEVVAFVEREFSSHPGRVQADRIPATLADVERVWRWTTEQCMEHFGPYEDAMTTRSVQLFHGRLSGLLNLHRLLPRRVLNDALAMEIPLNSKEGFVRQVAGWREFVRHVHRETDGFRSVPEGVSGAVRASAGQGAFLDATLPLPEAYWGAQSGLHCLDHAVQEVWDEGYTHHINRLMILANWATLLGVDPEALSDWFWVGFEDAYDWVVEPNVLGMGTHAVGDLMVTKPYVSGSAYVNKMSDYCSGCAFNPRKDCPMTRLYWDFLGRNHDALAANHRMQIPLASSRRRSDEKKSVDRSVAGTTIEVLSKGGRVSPETFDHSRYRE
jgi:deoxyribodipyrimidine photolyase-related protein